MFIFFGFTWGFIFSGVWFRRRFNCLIPLISSGYYIVYQIISTALGLSSGVFLFWVLDGSVNRQAHWLFIDDPSVWVVWVNAIHISALLYGTGGTTVFTPISVTAKLYAAFMLYYNIFTIGASWALMGGVVYDRKKEERTAIKKEAAQQQQGQRRSIGFRGDSNNDNNNNSTSTSSTALHHQRNKFVPFWTTLQTKYQRGSNYTDKPYR